MQRPRIFPDRTRDRLSVGVFSLAGLLAGALAIAPPASAHELSAAAPPSLGSILLDWSWDPIVIASLLVSGAVYVALVRRVNRLHPGHPWPWYRTAEFLAGLGSLALAILSPIDALADSLATVHMVQHMLLIMVAAPLFAASGPATLLLRASTHRVRERWVLPVLRSRVVGFLTFPAVGAIGLIGVLWATHYSAIYNDALLNPNVHIAEHLAYIVAGCLFWWPVASPDPMRWRLSPVAKLVYVMIQMPQMSFLAVSIMSAPHLLYEAYANRSLVYGVDALADQQASGAVMWIFGDMMFILEILIIIAFWMRDDDAEAHREDARLDRLRAAEDQARAESLASLGEQ